MVHKKSNTSHINNAYLVSELSKQLIKLSDDIKRMDGIITRIYNHINLMEQEHKNMIENIIDLRNALTVFELSYGLDDERLLKKFEKKFAENKQ